MIPVGLGLVWAGYTLGVWGYCLVRGYNVTFMQLFASTWPGVKKGKNPLAGGIVGPGVAQQIQNQARNQFGVSVQPTPAGAPTPAQQLTGQG